VKVSTKLYASVGSLLLLGVLVGVIGTIYLRSMGAQLKESNNLTAPRLDLTNAFRSRSWEMVACHRGAYFYAVRKNAQGVAQQIENWTKARDRAKEQLEELAVVLREDSDMKVHTDMEAALAAYERPALAFLTRCKEAKFDEITPLIPELFAAITRLDTVGKTMVDVQRTLLKESDVQADALTLQSLYVTLAVASLLLAIGILAVFTVRGITRTLTAAIGELSAGATQTASAAAQVSSSSQSLAQGSSEQAASLEETSASSEEITSMARKNTESSRAAADLVTQSQQKFQLANQALEQTVAAMGEINAQSGKISKIIKVIDEIAFQTNILALNAAVEAARAGDAGMGFAVVADEVRNLAQRCAQAARDTTELIEDSIAKSAEGKTRVDKVAAAVRAITDESAEIRTLVDEVNLGSQEQARGTEQIGKAITQMEQVTQTTAANAEESAAAAEQLTAQSETLKDVVRRLASLVGGVVTEPDERTVVGRAR